MIAVGVPGLGAGVEVQSESEIVGFVNANRWIGIEKFTAGNAVRNSDEVETVVFFWDVIAMDTRYSSRAAFGVGKGV